MFFLIGYAESHKPRILQSLQNSLYKDCYNEKKVICIRPILNLNCTMTVNYNVSMRWAYINCYNGIMLLETVMLMRAAQNGIPTLGRSHR